MRRKATRFTCRDSGRDTRRDTRRQTLRAKSSASLHRPKIFSRRQRTRYSERRVSSAYSSPPKETPSILTSWPCNLERIKGDKVGSHLTQLGIPNIIQVGASGSLGGPVLKALLSSEFTVSILARSSSKSTFPTGATVIKAEFDSHESLVEAAKTWPFSHMAAD